MKKKNNRGSISLLGATLTSILSLFLLFLVLKMQIEYKEALYRKKTYLCFKYLTTETKNYVSLISKLNWAIRSAYLAQASGQVYASASFKALVFYRNAQHVSYMKNMITNSYCSFPANADFVKHPPYQTKSIFILDTNFDETTKTRDLEWKNTIALIPTQIRISHIMGIEVHFKMEGAFSSSVEFSSKEIAKRDLLKLNRFSGYLSSL